MQPYSRISTVTKIVTITIAIAITVTITITITVTITITITVTTTITITITILQELIVNGSFYFDCVLGKGRNAKRANLGCNCCIPQLAANSIPHTVTLAKAAPNT